VNLVTLNNEQFGRICLALGEPAWAQDPRFADAASRLDHRHLINGMVADVIRRMPVAHWVVKFKAHDLLHAPVRSYSQCIDHPQARHLGTFQTLEQPGVGAVAFAGIPVHAMRRPVAASPRIGEHTEAVLRDAGFAEKELGALLRDRVVEQR